MKIPSVDFAIIGGSGTLSANFPKNFSGAEILAENLFFDTPYGKSPAFRLCSVDGKNFLTCKMHDKFFGRSERRASKEFFQKAASAPSIIC